MCSPTNVWSSLSPTMTLAPSRTDLEVSSACQQYCRIESPRPPNDIEWPRDETDLTTQSLACRRAKVKSQAQELGSRLAGAKQCKYVHVRVSVCVCVQCLSVCLSQCLVWSGLIWSGLVCLSICVSVCVAAGQYPVPLAGIR